MVAALILAATLVRLGAACALGLGVDESYMVATGRTLRLGYFDHPPAAWWLQWAAAHLFGTETPLVVRVPFIALFALSTWLTYRLGTLYAGRQAGLWAAVALTLAPVFGATTGTWVLPDGPLDAALLGAALALMHALSARGRSAWLWWSVAGLCAGGALFSKYSAVLSIGGAFLFLLTSPAHRRWLARPEPYLAGLLALGLFAPVLIWNATHNWASFVFQGDRAIGLRFQPWMCVAMLASGALILLPWIWLPMMLAFASALRRGRADWRSWLLCCLGAPPVVVFALIACWSRQRVLLHWAAPGYLMLFPLLGAWIVERANPRLARAAAWATTGLVLAVTLAVATQERTAWMHSVLAATTSRDPDIEAVDWTTLRDEMAARGLLLSTMVVAASNWRDGGKLAYALGPTATVICLCTDARQFGLNDPVRKFLGRDMLLVVVDQRSPRHLLPLFQSVEMLPPLALRQAGYVLEQVALYRATHLSRWPPG